MAIHFPGINETAFNSTGRSYNKQNNMKQLLLFLSIFIASQLCAQQTPCNSNPVYRQLDFWVGEWEAFGKNGNKAGDSKISIILDSCIILEEWTSVQPPKGIRYAGKSFNTYNAVTGQWQQTWVDNVGGTTEYLSGKQENNSMLFLSAPFRSSKDTMAIRKLQLFNLDKNKVRQLFEISKDNGTTWSVEYDLEYRRKKL